MLRRIGFCLRGTWIAPIAVLSTALTVMLVAQTSRADPGDIYVDIMSSSTSWANNSAFGHAFLCISYHLNSGIKEECFGFYSRATGAAMLIGGPGTLDNEAMAKRPDRFAEITASVAVKMDEARRKRVFQLTNDWNAKSYKLTDSNCIDFVHAVAGELGLKRPDRSKTQTPTAYVSGLKSLN